MGSHSERHDLPRFPQTVRGTTLSVTHTQLPVSCLFPSAKNHGSLSSSWKTGIIMHDKRLSITGHKFHGNTDNFDTVSVQLSLLLAKSRSAEWESLSVYPHQRSPSLLVA